jgi:hypothetical protein
MYQSLSLGSRATLVLTTMLSLCLTVCGQQSPVPPVPEAQGPYVPEKPSIKVNTAPPAPRPAARAMSDMDRFRDSRQSNQLLSSTIDTDHENAGVMTEKGGAYTGIFAVHPVYQTGTIQLKLPESATRTQILYAATSRPPNGSCLEVGTAYTTDIISKRTKVSVYVYDFCKAGGGNWAIPPIPVDGMSPPIEVDQDFMNRYAGAKTKNIHARAYAVVIFTPDTNITATSKWYAQIFNYSTKQWETKYSTQGSFLDDQRGWSIFETYFQTGLCSESLPDLGADELSLFNAATQKWEPISNKMPNLPVKITHGGDHNNNCFIADQTGPASYTVAPDPPTFYWWHVLSK